jgi:thioredoxin 1
MTLQEILDSKRPVLIDFFSDDCAPCFVLKEILDKVKMKMGDQCEIYTIDRVKHADVFKAFGITSVPHLKLFKKGKPVWEGNGLFNENELILLIQKHI